MLLLTTFTALLLATIAHATDRCFDGQYWMDPTQEAAYQNAFCPDGYRLAALPRVEDHFKAARLVYNCRGAGRAAWIASTNDGATYGGELAIVAPKDLGEGASPEDSVGGVVKASSAVLPLICERI